MIGAGAPGLAGRAARASGPSCGAAAPRVVKTSNDVASASASTRREANGFMVAAMSTTGTNVGFGAIHA
jgi:hypothetical protein